MRPDPAGDVRWVQDESAAILRAGDPRVWLFIPVYYSSQELGHTFRQRKLLERLQDELARSGARVLQTYSRGDSTAFLYEVPQPATTETRAELRF